MTEFWVAVGKNVILMTALTAWASAQVLKTITAFWKYETFKAERLVGSGGMPSSHTALVVGLASAIAFHDGLESPLFAVAVVLACIVMYDAAGVRQAAGKQARVLNKLVQELKADHTVHDTRLKELLGHTPLEVLAGALLGIGIAYLFNILYR